jgi:hypothetical protein
MPYQIRYPAPGGTGAVAGGTLVTACGTFDPFSSGGTATISGKVYSGTPTDAKPPPGASAGTCVATSNTWHFNACSPVLAGCSVGGSHTLRVWLTATNESSYFILDAPFTGCTSGSGACVPDCPGGAPGGGGGGGTSPPAAGCTWPVIDKLASRYFVLRPAPGVGELMHLFGVRPADVARWNIQLAYSEAASALDRAVWLSDVVRGEQLRLEVTCGSCCAQAFLARVRTLKTTIETLECWHAECFDLVKGGDLCRVTRGGPVREGGVSLRPPESSPPAQPATPRVVAKATAPKSNRRRARRGRA